MLLFARHNFTVRARSSAKSYGGRFITCSLDKTKKRLSPDKSYSYFENIGTSAFYLLKAAGGSGGKWPTPSHASRPVFPSVRDAPHFMGPKRSDVADSGSTSKTSLPVLDLGSARTRARYAIARSPPVSNVPPTNTMRTMTGSTPRRRAMPEQTPPSLASRARSSFLPVTLPLSLYSSFSEAAPRSPSSGRRCTLIVEMRDRRMRSILNE